MNRGCVIVGLIHILLFPYHMFVAEMP